MQSCPYPGQLASQSAEASEYWCQPSAVVRAMHQGEKDAAHLTLMGADMQARQSQQLCGDARQQEQ